MDNRVVSVIASKKRRKKKKQQPPRPDTLPNLSETPTVGGSTSTPINDQTNDNPNPTVLSIPQLTITPPEDDGSPFQEVYTPPEVNILSQCSSKRKKKKKKPPVLPVVKDEVRPSAVLGYTPRSLRKSVSVQPTVSELEEVCEESELQSESNFVCETSSRSSSHSEISQSVPELPEEEDETVDQVSLNCSESAYESADSFIAQSRSEHGIPDINSVSCSDCTSDLAGSSSLSELNWTPEELPKKDVLFSFYRKTNTNSESVSSSCEYSEDCTDSCIEKISPVSTSCSDTSVISSSFHVPDCHSGNHHVVSEKFTKENSIPIDCSDKPLNSPGSVSCLNSQTNSSHLIKDTVSDKSNLSGSVPKNILVNGLDLSGSNTSSSAESALNNSVLKTLSSCESKPCSTSNSVSPKSRKTMPESTSDAKQKTKAQKKAEKKSAAEAEHSAKTPAESLQNDTQPSGEKIPQNQPNENQKTKAQLKAERKAAFEAQKGIELATQKAQGAQKTKAELRAERRAVQESQRLAKEGPKDPGTNVSQKKPENVEVTKKGPGAPLVIADAPFKKQTTPVALHEKETTAPKMNLFSHLPQFHWDASITSKLGLSGKSVHPAVIRAGLRMAQGLISGSDARCVATLAAFREVIKDYSTPPQKELSRDLDSKVKNYTEFLNKCRPLSVSMTNAIKALRWHITNIPTTKTDAEAKEQLYQDIDTFIEEHIIISKRTIAEFASEKIHDHDVILIYGCSPLVKQVLSKAQEKKKLFKVIVVDARPSLDGREMVRYLSGKKIECSYVLINAVSYVMKEVKLVLLDCHSLQANGYVMSRVGSSQIALVAQASNVPVLVCCETYKFCDRVHTDAFVDNELGNPEDLVTSIPAHKSQLQNWKDMPNLNLVNITYDVTPADLVTAVVTELCTLPCTSVPVVLRVKHKMSDTQK